MVCLHTAEPLISLVSVTPSSQDGQICNMTWVTTLTWIKDRDAMNGTITKFSSVFQTNNLCDSTPYICCSDVTSCNMVDRQQCTAENCQLHSQGRSAYAKNTGNKFSQNVGYLPTRWLEVIMMLKFNIFCGFDINWQIHKRQLKPLTTNIIHLWPMHATGLQGLSPIYDTCDKRLEMLN